MVILNEHAVSLYLSAKIRRNFFWEICCKKYRFCKKNFWIFFGAIYLEKNVKFLEFLTIL